MQLWLFCLYIAITYSILRQCMAPEKSKRPRPGAPWHISMFVSALWPLVLVFIAGSDVFAGIKDLMKRKS